MYIRNYKLNIKKLFIILAIIAVAIAIVIELTCMYSDKNSKAYDYVLNEDNFTSILRDVHNNIDANVGKTVKLSGFVFTLPDFKKNNFVCGRNMMLDSEEKVVGFLCSYEGKNYEIADSEWVEITGHFIKGYYTTDIPVIQIDTIKKITAPTNSYVETPNFL